MRLTDDNDSFSATSASGRRTRLVKQGIGLVAVVTAGLLMAIAPRLPGSDMARGGLVLFGYGFYVFGVWALFRSRGLSAAEREEAIQRLTERADEPVGSPLDVGGQQLSALAQAVGVSRDINLPTPLWRPEREITTVGERQ